VLLAERTGAHDLGRHRGRAGRAGRPGEARIEGVPGASHHGMPIAGAADQNRKPLAFLR
jgi:hypothetical protein